MFANKVDPLTTTETTLGSDGEGGDGEVGEGAVGLGDGPVEFDPQAHTTTDVAKTATNLFRARTVVASIGNGFLESNAYGTCVT